MRAKRANKPIFGLLKRDSKVFVTIVENCPKNSLLAVIQGKTLEESTIHADGWKAYDGLVLNGYDHYWVYHSQDVIADALKGNLPGVIEDALAQNATQMALRASGAFAKGDSQNLRRRIFDNLDALPKTLRYLDKRVHGGSIIRAKTCILRYRFYGTKTQFASQYL